MDTSSAVEIAVNTLLDSIPDDSAQEILATYLTTKGVPFVIWGVEDFEAELDENWSDAVPKEARRDLAKRAYDAATEELSDVRAEDVMSEHIDGVVNDWKLSQQERVQYKIRLRNPANRSEVVAQHGYGVDGGEAHAELIARTPYYYGWGIVSISEAG